MNGLRAKVGGTIPRMWRHVKWRGNTAYLTPHSVLSVQKSELQKLLLITTCEFVSTVCDVLRTHETERSSNPYNSVFPSQYASISEEARKKLFPYEVHYLTHDFFTNYATKDLWLYDSIRLERNDPTVTDLRVIQYCPHGTILFKCNFNDDLQEVPRRPKKLSGNIVFPKLYKERLKNSESKWNHLQQLKSVIPKDCHSFYDNIPH